MILDPGDRSELIRYFRDECDELIHQIDNELFRLEGAASSGSGDAESIDSLFRALHTIKGSAGMLELHDVATMAHALENACESLRNSRVALSKALVDALFEGRDILTALIRSGIDGTSQPPPGTRENWQERIDAAAVQTAEPLREDAPAAPASRPDARTRTVRVDISRLDVLLDLVGELVIAKNRIVQIAGLLEDATLTAAAASLARTAGDLQESVMKARMVRISGVFQRFPMLVRDLAKSQGKEIDLEIEGMDTELDKTVVDELGEPLMHLVRNCIDHGIESPRRRRENRKPAVASLRLRAYQDGNGVVVEVSDDGAGIDLARVRERGIAMGLISASEEPDERTLLELLFVPGFSTARTVTELSGRGIGMDVVRRAIARLAGTLEVETRPGEGSTFTIRLPLTLAIVRVLLVRLAGQLYALPIDSVSESLRLDAAEVRRAAAGEVVTHRDRDLVLVRGAEFFELDDPRLGSEKVLIVVLAAGGRQVGLVVDAFVGEQEVVVKPISELVGPITGIVGGTILGDGAIALIVDPVALLNHVYPRSGSLFVSPSMR
ncbi:MAG TPA: chemotaxis protein CheA [Candidatus Acidoferrales bacterium]|nr:chemotaxis protein CheA [Candidatus Acidoferrales bacterium]